MSVELPKHYPPKPEQNNLFTRILVLANDLKKEGRSDFAHAIKTCPHRETIFKMHDAHRRSKGLPALVPSKVKA